MMAIRRWRGAAGSLCLAVGAMGCASAPEPPLTRAEVARALGSPGDEGSISSEELVRALSEGDGPAARRAILRAVDDPERASEAGATLAMGLTRPEGRRAFRRLEAESPRLGPCSTPPEPMIDLMEVGVAVVVELTQDPEVARRRWAAQVLGATGWIMRDEAGRALRALRDDPDAAVRATAAAALTELETRPTIDLRAHAAEEARRRRELEDWPHRERFERDMREIDRALREELGLDAEALAPYEAAARRGATPSKVVDGAPRQIALHPGAEVGQWAMWEAGGTHEWWGVTGEREGKLVVEARLVGPGCPRVTCAYLVDRAGSVHAAWIANWEPARQPELGRPVALQAVSVEPSAAAPVPEATGDEVLTAADREWKCGWSEIRVEHMRVKEWRSDEAYFSRVIQIAVDGEVTMRLVAMGTDAAPGCRIP